MELDLASGEAVDWNDRREGEPEYSLLESRLARL